MRAGSVLVVLGVAFAVALSAALWLVLVEGAAEDAALLKPDDRQLVARGRDVYAANCASCHGADLEGETADWRTPGPDGSMPAPPHDETGHTWHHNDTLLFAITKYGVAAAANLDDYVSAMPVYDGILSDEEIVAVLSYIKSTWPDEIREGHDELNARSAQERTR